MQISEVLLVSAIYEISNLDISYALQIVSAAFAILAIVLPVFWILICLYLSLSSYQLSEKENNKLGEFFEGLKPNKKHRFYISILMIRRIIYVTLLVVLISVPVKILIWLITGMQVFYLAFLICLRPYEDPKENIIEVTNEFLFLILLGSLSVFNKEEDWSTTTTYIYIQFIVLGTLIGFLIIMIFFFRTICMCAKKSISKSQKIAPIKISDAPVQSMEIMVPSQRYERANITQNLQNKTSLFEEIKEEEIIKEHKDDLILQNLGFEH